VRSYTSLGERFFTFSRETGESSQGNHTHITPLVIIAMNQAMAIAARPMENPLARNATGLGHMMGMAGFE